ncbi:NXPE family member 4 [Holothuria leucospilota]|uniref:NXPE family member 4 n=1 Tax=Holothuria leucospilota TaxID=206669 RepID=A0A9Q1BIT7_HOLLE|nr:NXPE family member 4 [Holothuria leucospilota]
MPVHEKMKPYEPPVITSPYTTKVTLVNPKTYYHVGEQVKIVIEARDDLNRTKLFGGDMFRVKLCSENPYAAVGADSFVDHHNGTYSASFPLLWKGNVSIKVMLSHPAEAIPLLRPTLNGSRAYLEQFSGDFETKGKNGTSFKENTPCSQIGNKVRKLVKVFGLHLYFG